MELFRIERNEATSREQAAWEERRLREPLVELAISAMCWSVLFGLVVSYPANGLSVSNALDVASAAGLAVLDHIGWGLGAYLAVLLGFYVVVIGRQFVADATTEHKSRRELGLLAVGLAGSVVPAVALVIVACMVHPSRAGALLVIVPATLLFLYLAVRLGSFGVIEREQRLKNAVRSEEWTRQRLERIAVRSAHSRFAVIAAHTAVGTLLAGATTVLLGDAGPIFVWESALFALIALGLTLAGHSGHYSLFTGKTALERRTSWLMALTLGVAALGLAAALLGSQDPSAGVGLLVLIGFIGLATASTAKAREGRLAGWTLQASAARDARQWLLRRNNEAAREIERLRETEDDLQDLSLRERVAAWLERM